VTVARRNRNRSLTKAQAIPAGASTFTPGQVAEIAAALALRQPANAPAAAPSLPRLDLANLPFGPGNPLTPVPINQPRPDTGRPEPRAYEYPVSVNLPGFSDRLVPWRTLRDAADNISIFRKCIEIRKSEVATLQWDIVISERAVERELKRAGGTARADLQQQMQKRLEPEIARMVDFWEEPDRRNGLDWIAWAKKLIEERLVLDAVAIYPRRTFGGDVYSLEIIDGSTIKPLLDEYGGRPLPPHPAYQQILYGFPRGDFIADTIPDGELPDGYRADQLIYEVDNVRTFTPYGYSAVERALIDGALYLQRNAWMLAEYTDGVMPSGWLKAGPGQADWSPTQLTEYERILNDYYAGITAARQRLRILPYGMEPVETQSIPEKYRPEYDLHLLKLTSGHFDTVIAELGFTEQGGLGSSGWHEGQADVQDRKATQPTLRAVEALVTKISRRNLGMPRELEFKILGQESEDAGAADEVADRRVKGARMTLNEDRDRLGLSRYPFKEADMPFLVGGDGGITFIDGAAARAEEAAQAAIESNQPDVDGEVVDDEDAPKKDTGKGKATSDVKKAETAALRRWARRNPQPRRPFRVEHLTKADVAALGVPLEHVQLAKADGGEPASEDPAPDQRWPAWQVDEAIAAAYTAAVTSALAAGLSTAAAVELAEAWLDAATAGASMSAEAWLLTRDIDIAGPLTEALNDLYTEAIYAGDRAAAAIVMHGIPQFGFSITVDWESWTPGDADAARQLLSADGKEVRLRHLLDQFGIVIKSIASRRLDELAAVLADGLEEGRTPDEIGRAVRGLVSDPVKARQIAITETARALSASSVAEYRDSGVLGKEWLHAADHDVCPACIANEDAGPIGLDDLFPSKDPFPPAHPWCRCAIMPADLDEDELTKAWDPSQHPRIPRGLPGAGRFRSLGSRLQDAMDTHTRKRGKGDPFAGFNREQLRRAAKARGIALTRGEDRDSIAKKLADDMRNGGKGQGSAPAGGVSKLPQLNITAIQAAIDTVDLKTPGSSTMGHKLDVYGSLRKSDFDSMRAQDRSRILGDLQNIVASTRGRNHDKARKLIDRFTPAGTPTGVVPKQAIVPPKAARAGQTLFSDPLGEPGLLKVSPNPGLSGDGWTRLPNGATGPWGKYGAAGILLRHQGVDGKDRYLMVKRGPAISDPGMWQFPGGAIDSNESPFEGATREVLEELGFDANDLGAGRVHGTHETSIPSGWKYTSIAATVPTMLTPNLSTHHARMETADAQWMTLDEIEALDKSGKMLKPLAGGKLQDNVMTLFPAGGARHPVTPPAPKLAHKPSKGKNLLTDKTAIDKLRQDIKQARHQYAGKVADDRLAVIGAMQGFDDTPTVLPKKEVDRLLATGDYVEAWRGVNGSWSKSAADINEEMRSGPAYYGRGIFGNGYYLATQKRVAENYSDRTKGSVVRILIPKTAITEPHRTVMKEAHAIASPLSKAKGKNHETGTLYDEGRYAAAKGIDGVLIEHTARSNRGGASHVASPSQPAYNWLNRSVLILEEA